MTKSRQLLQRCMRWLLAPGLMYCSQDNMCSQARPMLARLAGWLWTKYRITHATHLFMWNIWTLQGRLSSFRYRLICSRHQLLYRSAGAYIGQREQDQEEVVLSWQIDQSQASSHLQPTCWGWEGLACCYVYCYRKYRAAQLQDRTTTRGARVRLGTAPPVGTGRGLVEGTPGGGDGLVSEPRTLESRSCVSRSVNMIRGPRSVAGGPTYWHCSW